MLPDDPPEAEPPPAPTPPSPAGSPSELTPLAAEIAAIRTRLAALWPHARISRWDIGVWVAGGMLGIGGIVLAPVSGGLSLLASLLGLVLILIDVAKKLRDGARTPEARHEAIALLERLERLEERLRTLRRREDEE